MKGEISIFAWWSLAFLWGAVVCASGPLFSLAWKSYCRNSKRIFASVAVIAVSAIVLLRPHEDTFSGLDVSGYRHMAAAFAGGRGFHDVDTALLEAPLEIRSAFLLLPTMEWRNTRDRSFQIKSLERCETEPFFYPLVPAASAAFGKLITGSRDYLLPLLNVVLVSSWILFSGVSYGWVGIALSTALLLATPLPIWFLRGYVPEGTGALLCGCLLLQDSKEPRTCIGQAFALGSAISLHPMLVVLALPVLALRLLSSHRRGAFLIGFAAGLLPFAVMNAFICHPYGDIFALTTWRTNLQRVVEHRVLAGFLLVMMIPMCAFMLVRWCWPKRFGANAGSRDRCQFRSWAESPIAKWALAVATFLPAIVFLILEGTRGAFLRGASEAQSAFRAPGIVLFAAISSVALARCPLQKRVYVSIGIVALAICCVLKGLEAPGLWHQRRLLPGILFLAASLVPVAGVLSEAVSTLKIYRFGAALILSVLLVLAGTANALRWPALYMVRNEAGAQAWLDRLSQGLTGKTAFFDYHSYSFPLAVDVRRAVYGLGERARDKLPSVVAWFAERAKKTNVVFVTAFQNPGLEQGVAFSSAGTLTGTMQRIRSKTALPAESYDREFQVELLNVIPIEMASSLPRLSKVFDGGPLALRGEWLPRVHTLRAPDGRSVPAQWFRNGAGVIGPVAREGEHLVVIIQGTAGRRDPTAVQTVKLLCEDGSVVGATVLSNRWTTAEIKVVGRGHGSFTTATYRLHVDAPYNPSLEKIRGYPEDLGALLHRIDMWVEPADNRDDE